MPINSSSYTTSPNGDRTLSTSTPGYQAPPEDDSLKRIRERQEEYWRWEDEDRRRMELNSAAKPRSAGMGSAPRSSGGYRPPSSSPENAKHGLDRLLESEGIAAKLAQLRAVSGQAPTRMTTFASGAINGLTLDPMAMTGAQRQAFLPNNAGMEANGLTAAEQEEQVRIAASRGQAAPNWNQKMQNNPNSVENSAPGGTTDQMAAELAYLRQALAQLQKRQGGG